MGSKGLIVVIVLAVIVVIKDMSHIGIPVIDILNDLHLCSVVLEHAYIQRQGLQFLQKHLEGFRNTRLRNILALDDCFVCLDSPDDIIGLDRQNFLKRIGSTICLERPDLHLSETLASGNSCGRS